MFFFFKNNRISEKRARKSTALVLLCTFVLITFFSFFEKAGFRIAAAEAPAQTYNIHSAQDFIAYSRAYASGERNRNDVLNVSINEGNVVTDDGFVSIGTSECPFSGVINVPSAGIDIFHLFDCPLFDYVSTDFRITGAGTIKIIRERVSETPDDGVLTSGALFANHVIKGTNAAVWNIALLPYDGELAESSSYEGVIGDIEAAADVTVNFTNTSTIPVSAGKNVGLICGTLNDGARLTVTTAGSGAALSVTATAGHAGGLVGEMKTGSTLKFGSANLSRVNQVTASAGYAGGIVGVAQNITVEYAAGITDYTVSGGVTGQSGAGGLFGRYVCTTSPFTFDMLNTYQITSGMTVSSSTGNYAGGIFGMLESNAASFIFDGNSASESIVVTLSGGTYRGGICGGFKASALTNTFEIYDTATTVTAATSGSSGIYSAGLIGTLMNVPAYVNIHDVSCTSGSSPDGGLIGTTGTGGSFVDVTGNVSVSGTFDAGFIANMPHGVLRMSGVCNLGGYVSYSSASGFLVKERNRALVYALGNGSGSVGNWTFKRNTDRRVDDIHTWGEVIRTDGTILKESDLFTVDMTAHTVTVAAAVPTMSTVTDFAKTALNIKLNTGAGVGALQFTSGNANLSNTLLAGTLTLSNDIALTGTGLVSLTRDDGNNTPFSGTLEGNNHTITFATGEKYGVRADGTPLDANSKQGCINQHGFNGLFAKTSDATVQNLTLDGAFNFNQTLKDLRLGGVVTYARNALTLDNVTTAFTVSTNITSTDGNAFYGGAVGIAGDNGLNVTIENSDISLNFNDESSAGSSNAVYVGGAIAVLVSSNDNTYPTKTDHSPTQHVTFTSSDLGLTYNKTGSASRPSVFGSAIANCTNCNYVKDNRQVTFDDVDVSVTVTGGRTVDRKFGGILGADWYVTDVTVDDVRIDSSISATGTAADFGGLVRTATGRWDVQKVTVNTANYTLPSASGSTFGFIANITSVTNPASALYLDVNNTGSNYDIAALSFTGNSPPFTVFDEIVADSRVTNNNLLDNGNSIISITTSDNIINTSGSYNTYLNKTAYGQLASAKINPNTRYYYNIGYARANTATAKYNFLVWSVKTYAHSSLQAWFTASNTFTGNLDMTGLSYYPVDLKSGVTFNNATVKLDNVLMEANVKYAYSGEAGTRSTRSNTNQHYLMHTAIFRNDPGSNLTISGGNGLTIAGNIPKISDSFCGFLIAGTFGNSDRDNVRFNASKISFDGAHIVTNTGADLTTSDYAPLLINKVGKNSSVTINAADQSTTAYAGCSAAGKYAASSLIGDVGSSTARAIYLTFTGLKFDGRSTATSIGNMDTAYGTEKSIFSRATILNSFLYSGESAGSYIYEVDEDWSNSTTAVHNVTYGKEVTTSVEFADRQKNYYGSPYFTDPTTYHAASAYDFSTGFLPHVYTPYNLAEYKRELAVNVTFNSEIKGCGKYDDPFIIDDDEKLPIISRIINGQNVGSSVAIYLPDDLTSYNYTDTGYTKYAYNFGTDNFTSSNGGSNMATTNVRRYLAGAYYVITKDIELPDDYVGLGTVDNSSNTQYAFRGILIGRHITVTNRSRSPLIHTSLGSVVKDITVTVDVNYGSSNEIELAAPAGNSTYNYIGGIQSYGAVIGQILGGDNIIDNTQVEFDDVSFSITAASATNYERLTPIGGYVGTLFSGGLIFRNMTSANVGLTNSVCNKINDAGYLYVNPIIGRVINGYAFHETSVYAVTSASIPNGNKNYTIPDLSLSAGKLNVTGTGAFTVNVPDGQAMYILGAIINSGAGSAAYNETTEQDYQGLSGFWQAYRAHTTTRAGSGYSTVGTSSGEDYTTARSDKYSNGLAKVPYIISAYTNKTGSVYVARCIATNAGNTVKITGDCDVAAGFRGIGSIYLDSTYVRLGVKICGGYNGNASTVRRVTLHMRFIEYDQKSVTSYSATAGTAGFGLFNILQMSSANSTNSINNLTMAGDVYYDILQVASGNQSAYKFKESADGVCYENVLSVGSVIGYAKARKFYLKKITIDGLYVEGARYTGGLVGFSGDTESNQCTFDSCGSGSSSTGISVKSGVVAGGLIGYMLGVIAVNSAAAGGQTTAMIDQIELKCLDTADSLTSASANSNKESLKWLARDWVYGAGGILGLIQPRALNLTTVTDYVICGKPGNAKHIFSTSTSQSQYTHTGGFFGITKNRNAVFTNVKLEDMNIVSPYSGGIVGSAITDKADSSEDVLQCIFNNVTVDGQKNAESKCSIEGYIAAGGFIGNMQQAGSGGGKFYVESSTVKNYNIASSSATNTGNQTAGGFLGYSAPNNSNSLTAVIHNFNVKDCAISNAATGNANSNGTGGLFGAISRTYIKGYNILISGTSITATAPYQRTTTIVGNNRDSVSYIRLVGVSAQLADPTTATTRSRNVGSSATSGTFKEKYGSYTVSGVSYDGYVVFADFVGTQGNTAFAGIDDTSVSTDNYTDVAAADPYVTANPVMTTGGITLTSDGVGSSVATLPIQSILTDTASGRYTYAASSYYTGSSGDTNFTAFSPYTGKLAMFRSEVPTYLGTDFPVLILDNTTREASHKMINSYLRLLTNTKYDFGTDTTDVYEVKIYNMSYDEHFTPHTTGASLKRDGGQFFMLNSQFDSGKTQFSLLDIRFFDPEDNTKTAYHLYVPIFVKKVLSFNFDIALLSGTTYLDSLYTSHFGQALIENVGTPVTFYFKYTYSRTAAEWADSINLGEDVHRNYDKNLLFYKANTNALLEAFPAETVLTLVDTNDGNKPYYATLGDAFSGNTLSLGAFKDTMRADGLGGYTFTGNSFSPKTLESLMNLSAASDPAGTLVPCAEGDATVVVSGQGYRLATDEELEDGGVTKYTVSVSSVNPEGYYLSMYTQSNAVNDELFHYFLITTPTSFNDVLHPSKILDTGAHTMVHLVMGKIFYHSDLDVTSNSSTGSPMMTASNNLLVIDMTAEFGLSDNLDSDIKPDIQRLIAATDVFQSFIVYLNRKENSGIRKVILGSPTATGSYAVDYVLNQTADSAMGAYGAGLISVSQNCAEFVTGDLSDYFSSGDHFEINSSVTLTYSSDAIPTQFPGRTDIPPSDSNGVTVSASSNIAFQQNATSYTKNTIGEDEYPVKSYYSETAPEVATLDLNPVGDRVGDFSPLGINALNNDDATVADFDLLANLNIAPIADRLTGYTDALVMIQLAKKQSDGTYGNPLDITQYMSADFEGLTGISSDATSYYKVIDRTDLTETAANVQPPVIHCHILTGSALEIEGFDYCNYRITVTMVLRNNGNNISVSQASNYVIYTNAKIIPDYVS